MIKHSFVLIDDDPLILTTLKQRFDGWEAEVFAAGTPQAAKEILEKVTPEVVLLDLLLTKDDGAQGIIDYMKSQDRLAHVPILVLTNLDKPELKQMLLEQGVKEYLIKGSISLDDLYDKVIGYIEPQKSE